MKYFCISILLLIITSRLFGQVYFSTNDTAVIEDTTYFKLFINISCDNLAPQDINYKIVSIENDSPITYTPDSSGICSLPRNYEYIVFTCMNGTVYNVSLIRVDEEKQIDTIVIPPIYESTISSRNKYNKLRYYHCGEICNGYQKSFRPGGQLWQEGEFKNGKLKIFKEYSEDGSLNSLVKKTFLCNSILVFNKDGGVKNKLKRSIFIFKYQTFDENQKKTYSKRTLNFKRNKINGSKCDFYNY